MGIGAAIRSACGPFENVVTEGYRRLFVDLDHLVEQLGKLPSPDRVLEIGCGEGAVTTRLASAFPFAHIMGIDLTPRIGRNFVGSSRNVVFRRQTAQSHAASKANTYDWVLIVDVLHHVSPLRRAELMASAVAAARPRGTIVVKEWIKSCAPIHWAGWASDRLLTGDRVQYFTAQELRLFVENAVPGSWVLPECRLRPWANNVMLARSAEGAEMLGVCR